MKNMKLMNDMIITNIFPAIFSFPKNRNRYMTEAIIGTKYAYEASIERISAQETEDAKTEFTLNIEKLGKNIIAFSAIFTSTAMTCGIKNDPIVNVRKSGKGTLGGEAYTPVRKYQAVNSNARSIEYAGTAMRFLNIGRTAENSSKAMTAG